MFHQKYAWDSCNPSIWHSITMSETYFVSCRYFTINEDINQCIFRVVLNLTTSELTNNHLFPISPPQSHRPCLRHPAQHSRQVPAHHPGEQRSVRGAALAGRRHHRRGAPQEVHRVPHLAAAHQGADARAADGRRVRCGRRGHGQRRRRPAGGAESDCRLMRVAFLPAVRVDRVVCKLGVIVLSY